jgi:hypothetical protein
MQTSTRTGPILWINCPIFSPAQSLAWPKTSPFSHPIHTFGHLSDNDDINTLKFFSIRQSYTNSSDLGSLQIGHKKALSSLKCFSTISKRQNPIQTHKNGKTVRIDINFKNYTNTQWFRYRRASLQQQQGVQEPLEDLTLVRGLSIN